MPYEIEGSSVRVHNRTNMDSVTIEDLYYRQSGQDEMSVVMRAESGHVLGAVPVLDIVKYALLHQPGLLETARTQLEAAAEEQHKAAQAEAVAKHDAGVAFCEAFLTAFPSKRESSNLACDGSDTWMQMIDGAPTTGEGCIVNGLPVYDHYSQNYELYDLGILKTVAEWAKTQGMYGEPYDAGTLKFYRI
jgi:hypothetical protein